jgi:Alpha/beta hydrolase domain containing 18
MPVSELHMISWRRYVKAREALLAAESDPIKTSSRPEVGLDILVPNAARDDFSALLQYVRTSIDNADHYFAINKPIKFDRQGSDLTFRSPIPSARPGPNDVARGTLFEARSRDRAIVLLPHWNSDSHGYYTFGRMLAHFGITCLQLTLPYHNERQTPGVNFARELVSENLGLTIQSNRQAIVETRACLSWLQTQGYRHLGLVGASIGSSLGSIVAALDDRVCAAVLLLMADDFAEVVWTGSATKHIKYSLEQRFTLEDLQSSWSIISPATYATRLSDRIKDLLIVSGKLDTVFLPELTKRYIDRLNSLGLRPTWIRLGCGHYTLSLPPYSWIAFLRTLLHLRNKLQ